MGLTRMEQETVIRYNAEEDFMEIYTAYPPLMRKLDEQPAYTKIREDKYEGEVIAMTFKADKKLLTLRSKRKTGREMSEEERQKVAERFAKARSEKSFTVSTP